MNLSVNFLVSTPLGRGLVRTEREPAKFQRSVDPRMGHRRLEPAPDRPSHSSIGSHGRSNALPVRSPFGRSDGAVRVVGASFPPVNEASTNASMPGGRSRSWRRHSRARLEEGPSPLVLELLFQELGEVCICHGLSNSWSNRSSSVAAALADSPFDPLQANELSSVTTLLSRHCCRWLSHFFKISRGVPSFRSLNASGRNG